MAYNDEQRNRLLAKLSADEYAQLIAPQATLVELDVKQTLYESHEDIDYIYFPQTCVCSALTLMRDGSAIEVASIGREGATGLTAYLGVPLSPHRVIVQIAGSALRVRVEHLREATNWDSGLGRILILYHNVFLAIVSQSVACNGLHPIQKRCCRWLLMTRDRTQSDEIMLTHEFLAMMLGVRRATVTEVLQGLQELGLIRYGRGSITIVNHEAMEAACCECYRVVRDAYDTLLR